MILDVIQLAGISWMDPNWWLDQFGQEFFWLSVAIIFVECGLFFPFLPGDTLLFAIGLFIATDRMEVVPGNKTVDIIVAMLILSVGAFLGNVAGYEIGRKIGPPLAQRDGRVLKKKYFDQTRDFFEKHGNKALVIGRFVPFVRTYVTVVAGVAQMERRRFITWSAVGAVLWVVTITLLGYVLGKRFPGLGDNIDIAIGAILAFSAIPVAYEWVKHRRQTAAAANLE
ncbi:MAG: VTT domain-containing protein [Propionibacteriales bacterium]|nr:VTT domain-containing protein [Propionibacteriales bacterium]